MGGRPPRERRIFLLLRLRIHPLFLLFLVLYTVLGGIGGYLVAFTAVFLHECAHYAMARVAGARSLTMTLMPYGAALRLRGEVPHVGVILLAGPFANLVTAAFCLAASWLLPEVHAYLRTFIKANVHIALVNLIPAYPLDGGRLLREMFGGRGARHFTNAVTLLAGAAAVTLFFVKGRGNWTLLTFGAFMLSYFGAFCLPHPVTCAPTDPLFRAIVTDEGGSLRGVRVRRKGRTLYRLTAEEVTALALRCDGACPLEEALLRVFPERVKRADL